MTILVSYFSYLANKCQVATYTKVPPEFRGDFLRLLQATSRLQTGHRHPVHHGKEGLLGDAAAGRCAV